MTEKHFPQKAKKSLGQHFLKDQGYLKKIVDTGAIGAEDMVIEIGPGRGALTYELVAKKPRKLLLIEKDQELIGYLQEEFGKYDFVEIIHGDICTYTPPEEYSQYILMGNIPYYISTPIVSQVLSWKILPQRIVFLTQKEFAHKLTASTPTMTYLGVLLQTAYRVQIVDTVPPGAFSPPPKVQSAIVEAHFLGTMKLSRHYKNFLQKSFLHARKKLTNTIDKSLLQRDNSLDTLYIQELLAKRPQELSPSQWMYLYSNLIGHDEVIS